MPLFCFRDGKTKKIKRANNEVPNWYLQTQWQEVGLEDSGKPRNTFQPLSKKPCTKWAQESQLQVEAHNSNIYPWKTPVKPMFFRPLKVPKRPQNPFKTSRGPPWRHPNRLDVPKHSMELVYLPTKLGNLGAIYNTYSTHCMYDVYINISGVIIYNRIYIYMTPAQTMHY